MLLGIGLGFWVGLLPGLGGATTLALMLPFIYTMQPVEAFAFLLGMHAVVATTGDITSVLFGLPGEATSAATVVDGYAMTKKGEAGRALGAALASSLVGAIVGAVALAAAIPVVRPLVLTFGSPELFMLAIVGLAFIASLSGEGTRGMVRGFIAAGLGLLLATVGQDPQAGVARFTFDLLYLWQGLDLVPVLVGIFAIPEIIDLAGRGTSIAGSMPKEKLSAGALEGVKDTFRHFWLTIRCSLIGTFIGILPGLGGSVAQWMAYGHATQSARTAEERKGFGQGDVRGVLGPGAANNSKEGGSLVPTIAFGVPGSTAMAILLGGFVLLGLVPGPDMLTKHLPLTFSMVWTIVIQYRDGARLLPVPQPSRASHHGARLDPDPAHPGAGVHRQLHLEQQLRRPRRDALLRRDGLSHGAGRLAARAVRARPRARQDRRELSLHLDRALRSGMAHAAGGAGPDRDRRRSDHLSAVPGAAQGGACLGKRRSSS